MLLSNVMNNSNENEVIVLKAKEEEEEENQKEAFDLNIFEARFCSIFDASVRLLMTLIMTTIRDIIHDTFNIYEY